VTLLVKLAEKLKADFGVEKWLTTLRHKSAKDK
jgi:hypothetical protein